eukprot:TRINITY_DN8063_c0_g1_i1.p1 TRINITY_DN8063_c0_g1~~TRINITY_DN8063_c0_g1_i1.p1  ORF type:complete len:161 (-),score=23.07 TRINITY_DN8063_c0_g1_i1:61-543(-)
MMFRVPLDNETFMDDLYDVLSPIVGSIRGDSGLINSTVAFAFQTTNQRSRPSQIANEIDFFSIRKLQGQSDQSPLVKEVNFKEADALSNFIAHLNALFHARGLNAPQIPISQLFKDKSPKFWLSDLSLNSHFHTTSSTSTPTLHPQITTLKSLSLSLIHI